jgi:hypothetical protein
MYHHECGYRLNTKLLCQDGSVVDVDGRDLGFALELVLESFEFGGHGLTRTTPFGSELEQNGKFATEYLGFEVLLGDLKELGHADLLTQRDPTLDSVSGRARRSIEPRAKVGLG